MGFPASPLIRSGMKLLVPAGWGPIRVRSYSTRLPMPHTNATLASGESVCQSSPVRSAGARSAEPTTLQAASHMTRTSRPNAATTTGRFILVLAAATAALAAPTRAAAATREGPVAPAGRAARAGGQARPARILRPIVVTVPLPAPTVLPAVVVLEPAGVLGLHLRPAPRPFHLAPPAPGGDQRAMGLVLGGLDLEALLHPAVLGPEAGVEALRSAGLVQEHPPDPDPLRPVRPQCGHEGLGVLLGREPDPPELDAELALVVAHLGLEGPGVERPLEPHARVWRQGGELLQVREQQLLVRHRDVPEPRLKRRGPVRQPALGRQDLLLERLERRAGHTEVGIVIRQGRSGCQEPAQDGHQDPSLHGSVPSLPRRAYLPRPPPWLPNPPPALDVELSPRP